MKVALIGASAKPERMAYKALHSLLEKGYDVYPVHPTLKEVEGLPVYSSVSDIPESVDLVTVYVNARNSTPMIEDILALEPQRILLNPGAENPKLSEEAHDVDIPVEEACTLVLLGTGQL